MKVNDLSILLGGDAGQGIQSTGLGLCQALGKSGLTFFGRQDYRSQVRGGHNFYQIRIGEESTLSHREELDLIIALTAETVTRHVDKLRDSGGVLYPRELELEKQQIGRRDVAVFDFPLKQIAREEGGAEVMTNTAAVGALAGLLGFEIGYLKETIEENFSSKGEEIVKNNIKVAEAGCRYAEDRRGDFSYSLKPPENPDAQMVLDGNQAFALGAIAGGCNFISAYPMTPSTSIFETLIGYSKEFGIVYKQTESELAAINMALGASHVGARSLVSTSGGGFSLMVEGLGLAGMTETPVVIAEVQRPGPSTGLPTRTAQGDLSFVTTASQGEFPRLVLTPGTIEEYFHAGAEAFNLAEKYQTPVIVLADQHLADSVRPIPPSRINMSEIDIDRGKLLSDDQLDNLEDQYLRHQFCEDGISPRAVPHHPNAIYSTTGNEHDQRGKITEDPQIRSGMVEKRMEKLETARQDLLTPHLSGDEEAELLLIGWGSTFGALQETVDLLNENGNQAKLCHLPQTWPFPREEISEEMENADLSVVVEGNHNGQLNQLISQETGYQPQAEVLKYDGRPFTPDYIVKELENLEVVS